MPRMLAPLFSEILTEIEFIRISTHAHTLQTFTSDGLVRRAVERALLTISEAVKHIPDNVLASQPHIPWKSIRGMGNMLRHEYHKIAPSVVWDVIQHHLKSLEKATQEMQSVNL
ncbi:MAG: HepT-like ribonuclease domain-containing protein [Alphaproteobacteria bacterium]